MKWRQLTSSVMISTFLVACSAQPFDQQLLTHDPIIREKAFAKLAKLSASRKAKLVPAMMDGLAEEDPSLPPRALDALVVIGPPAIPALIKSTNDPNVYIRISAAVGLGRIGLPAKEAIPVLTVALKDPHPLVRQEAAFALGKMGTEAEGALPLLNELLLNDQDSDVRLFAHESILKIKKPS